MEVLEVLLWIIGVLVIIGVIVGILAFLGLRRLWRFVDDAFTDDGRPGPGPPPGTRRRTTSGTSTASPERRPDQR